MQDIVIEPGTYVVAVSGGVDSMTLLNVLSKKPTLRLVVAHFEHGMREDSVEDRLLVQETANDYGLPFVFLEGRLGVGTSEADARSARYTFLKKVQKASGAEAIVTAHHQDDTLETAIHNLLRGTGRKGMTSLSSNTVLLRPLLHLSKQELRAYAKEQDLKWREDSSNDDLAYTRNYIRHEIIPKLTKQQKSKLLAEVKASHQRNSEIDQIIEGMLAEHSSKKGVDRQWFTGLPHQIAREVMAAWLRQNEVREFDKKLIEQLVQSAKTAKPGAKANVNKAYKMVISKQNLALVKEER